MIVKLPYQCDICRKLKTEGEDWLIGKINADVKFSYPWDSDENVTVAKWSDRVVEKASDEIAHLCSGTCAKQWMAKGIDTLTEPSVEVVSASVPVPEPVPVEPVPVEIINDPQF